jgi:hypothetical protein
MHALCGTAYAPAARFRVRQRRAARACQAHAPPPPSPPPSRRALLAATLAAAAAARAPSALALPLAPLGPVVPFETSPKRTGLTSEQMAVSDPDAPASRVLQRAHHAASLLTSRTHTQEVIGRDISVGKYFINGAGLSQEVFADDCRFRDPTNDIVGLKRYVTALDILFDAASSSVALLSVRASGPREVTAVWTLGGYLKLPWHPYVPPFEGSSVYTMDERGLIVLQDETWSVSAWEALRETFTPTAGPPAAA